MVSGETHGSSCRPNCQSMYIYCKAGATGVAGTAMAAPLFPKSELFLYSVV